MLNAVDNSASTFPVISSNLGAGQPVGLADNVPQAVIMPPPAAVDRHRQAFAQFHVEAALNMGHASGMVFHGFKLDSRETYVTLRLRGKVELGAAQHAIDEWNRLASAHVKTQAANVFDQHRQHFIKAYVDLVIEGGVAPGLVLSGTNIENRRAYVVSRINGNFGLDIAIQAQAQWNKLADEHTRDVAGNLYVRLHPLPLSGATVAGPLYTPQMLASELAAQERPAADLAAYRLKQLSLGSGPAAAHHAAQASSAPIICDPMHAAAEPAKMPDMPVRGEEFSAEQYAVLRSRHQACSRAFLEEFMRCADDTLLFQIYIDPDMQGNQYDLQDMASKTLFTRRP